MPHFIVEYSANLEQAISIEAMVSTVHEAAIATGIFPLKGTRTRAEKREIYRIADGHRDNAFVHVTAHIGHGRTGEVRRIAAEAIYDALCEFLRDYFERAPLAVSFDMQEINSDTSFKSNNLPQWIERRKSSLG